MKEEELLLKLGQKVRFERIKRKLSQEKLAEKACLNPRSISVLECGLNNTKLLTLISVAKALNLEIKDLFDFTL